MARAARALAGRYTRRNATQDAYTGRFPEQHSPKAIDLHLKISKFDLKTFKLDEIFTSMGNLFQDNIILSLMKFLLIRFIFESLNFPG